MDYTNITVTDITPPPIFSEGVSMKGGSTAKPTKAALARVTRHFKQDEVNVYRGGKLVTLTPNCTSISIAANPRVNIFRNPHVTLFIKDDITNVAGLLYGIKVLAGDVSQNHLNDHIESIKLKIIETDDILSDAIFIDKFTNEKIRTVSIRINTVILPSQQFYIADILNEVLSKDYIEYSAKFNQLIEAKRLDDSYHLSDKRLRLNPPIKKK